MVCGPRGSGKTAAVRETLEGQKGVVIATLADESQKLARAITESLGLRTNKEVDHTEVVVNALKEIRREPGYVGLEHPPVLVVSENESTDSCMRSQQIIYFLFTTYMPRHYIFESTDSCMRSQQIIFCVLFCLLHA